MCNASESGGHCDVIALRISAVSKQLPGSSLPGCYHGLGYADFHCTIGARALGVDNDPDLVVDEIVRIVGEEWVHARPGNPCRLRIGQRDLFRGLAPTAAVAARTATVPVTTLLIAGGIEDREVLSNRTGCFLRLSVCPRTY
jgi:hypothetical protein